VHVTKEDICLLTNNALSYVGINIGAAVLRVHLAVILIVASIRTLTLAVTQELWCHTVVGVGLTACRPLRTVPVAAVCFIRLVTTFIVTITHIRYGHAPPRVTSPLVRTLAMAVVVRALSQSFIAVIATVVVAVTRHQMMDTVTVMTLQVITVAVALMKLYFVFA